VLPRRAYYVHFGTGYHRISLPVEGAARSDRAESASARLFLAYALIGGRVDLSLAFDARGSRFEPSGAEGGEAAPSTSHGDMGDSRLGVRFALPTFTRRLRASAEAFATLPTGNPDKGFSADATDGGLLLGLSVRGSAFRVHLQTGYRVNRNESEGALLYPLFYPQLGPGEDDTQNDALILRGALEIHSRRLDLFAEVFADRLLRSGVVSARENVLEFAPGVRVRLRRGLHLSGQAGFCLSRDDPSTTAWAPPEILFPDWRVSVGVHWIGILGGTDADDDGIPDGLDRCPNEPEDYDGFEDDDGCPDPDNDGDGIPDAWDKAPLDAEDRDGFEDEDGVPDVDNDEDGIPDAEDFCPDEAEDADGDRDDDGCPDLDPAPESPQPEPSQEAGKKP
jgi:hypothetical protein